MIVRKRVTSEGIVNYYDWDCDDGESVPVLVQEVCTNCIGKPFVKMVFDDELIYANVSPYDAERLVPGCHYRMICTSHYNEYKYLRFEKIDDNMKDYASQSTQSPSSSFSDWLMYRKAQLEEELDYIDQLILENQ